MIIALIMALMLYFGMPIIEVCIWNSILVDLFSLPVINYLQMFAIHVFCSLLFGGISFSGSDD